MFLKKIKAVVVFLFSTIAILAHADFPGDILYSANNSFERASTKLQACQNAANSFNLRKFINTTDWIVSEYEGEDAAPILLLSITIGVPTPLNLSSAPRIATCKTFS